LYNFEDGIRYILEALGDLASSARQALRNAIWALPEIEVAYRFSTERIAADELGQHHHRDLVLEAYTLVIRLLPRVASFGLDHPGRLRELSGAEMISRNAAARATAAGRDADAVEMLEEGRGVFWSQALRLRTTDLAILPTQEADELRRLFRLLDIRSIDEPSTSTVERERLVENYRRLSAKAEALIADIRSRPGVSRFLLPPAFSSLVQSLPEGFVVFLNVSELGHHALILNGSTKSVQSLMLRLPARIVRTSPKAVKDKSSQLREDDDELSAEVMERSVAEEFRAGIREPATFGDTLADLWVYIVRPIIEELRLKVGMHARQPSRSFTEKHLCRSQAVGTDRVSGGAPHTHSPSFQSMLQGFTRKRRESVLELAKTAHLTTSSRRTSPASRRSCEPEMVSAAWHEATSRACYCTRAVRDVDGPA
jgi:hypothetical protein